MSGQNRSRVIRTVQLGEFFHHAVQDAARRRHLRADAATLHYLALLLCRHSRSEFLFDFADGRLQIRPLALLYGEALQAGGQRERRLWLQRLGDLALFVGGLFDGQLSRRFRDLDYCVAMGGSAFGYLEQTAPPANDQALVFGELAAGFARFVDVVAVVTARVPPALDG